MIIRANKALMVDPLAVFIERAAAGKVQIPLVSTEYDVAILGGLAIVSARRTFCNDEEASIEAVLTFPVPVHATVFSLKAKIDKRVLTAKAQPREQARETYEEGLAAGKSSILHEELLRGIHMLSVGHIGPGKTIEVIIEWAMPLNVIAGQPGLRIPLTVGQVYGQSGLPDTDELVSDGPNRNVRLSVACEDGPATVVGGRLIEGQAFVPLNAPIDLLVPLWQPQALTGMAADGRRVEMRIKPIERTEAPIHAAILVDHSGSMAEMCSSEEGALSKHETLKRGLSASAEMFNRHDTIELFEFDMSVRKIGIAYTSKGNLLGQGDRSVRRQLKALVQELSDPRGGTEIGQAISHVMADTSANDILVITDGKSHALDVQKLACSGQRISAVLVGEDSLEAHIGHLAALTGGQIFVPGGHDLADVISTALDSLRTAFSRPDSELTAIANLATCQVGVEIVINWSDRVSAEEEAAKSRGDKQRDRAIVAVATGTVLPNLRRDIAIEMATAQGLVTHLTSFVLVDEDGETHEGLPTFRKVPLAEPFARLAMSESASPPPFEVMAEASHRIPSKPRSRAMYDRLDEVGFARRRHSESFACPRPSENWHAGSGQSDHFTKLSHMIDWVNQSGRLQTGDVSGLEPQVRSVITRMAGRTDIKDLANLVGISPTLLAILLLALSRSDKDRLAGRLARHLLSTLIGDRDEILHRFARLMQAMYLPLPESLIEFAARQAPAIRTGLLGWLSRTAARRREK